MNVRRRPPRRVPFTTNTWRNQAPQYDRPDITPAPGIVYWRVPEREVPVPVHCLLHYEPDLTLTGILNWFPAGSPFGEQPGDFLVLVHPDYRRRGIGKLLVLDASMSFQVDLLSQAYTDAGWACAQAALDAQEQQHRDRTH